MESNQEAAVPTVADRDDSMEIDTHKDAGEGSEPTPVSEEIVASGDQDIECSTEACVTYDFTQPKAGSSSPTSPMAIVEEEEEAEIDQEQNTSDLLFAKTVASPAFQRIFTNVKFDPPLQLKVAAKQIRDFELREVRSRRPVETSAGEERSRSRSPLDQLVPSQVMGSVQASTETEPKRQSKISMMKDTQPVVELDRLARTRTPEPSEPQPKRQRNAARSAPPVEREVTRVSNQTAKGRKQIPKTKKPKGRKRN